MKPNRRHLPLLSFALPAILLLSSNACTGADAVPDQAADVAAEQSAEPASEAEVILAAALAEAGRTDRLVFLHSGAPW